MDLAISESPETAEPMELGSFVRFTIRITNLMDTLIQVLPLRFVYDASYLAYGYNKEYAIPSSDDLSNTGVIEWGDLTESFGTDLGPGDSFTVVVTFTAERLTAGLPNGKTMTKTIVDSAWAGTGGSGNLVPLPLHEASAGVQIIKPKLVVLASFDAVAQDSHVLVTWETETEIDNLGFNLYRAESADGHEPGGSAEPLTRLNEDLIPNQELGGPLGAHYEFVDESVVPAVTYYYWLETVDTQGGVKR